MSEKMVDVEVTVAVKVDEAKFTEEFKKEFRDNFYDFDTIDDHIDHLAQLAARVLIENLCFIEVYGDSKEMGITAKVMF